MTDLRVLCRYDVVVEVAKAWKKKAAASENLKDADETATLHSYLNRLEVVCQRALDAPEEATKIAILRLTDDEISNIHVRGMSKEREEFVAYLAATPEAVEGFLEAPFSLVRSARDRLRRWETLNRPARMSALRLYVAGMQFGLQLVRPIRPDNLRLLTIDGDGRHIRAPSTGRGNAIMRLPPTQTKNRRRLEHELPKEVWAIVAEWIDVWRPRWLEVFRFDDSAFLVPGASASGALSVQSSCNVFRGGRRRCLAVRESAPGARSFARGPALPAVRPRAFPTGRS